MLLCTQFLPPPTATNRKWLNSSVKGGFLLLISPLALLEGGGGDTAPPGFFFQSHSEDVSCSIPGRKWPGKLREGNCGPPQPRVSGGLGSFPHSEKAPQRFSLGALLFP